MKLWQIRTAPHGWVPPSASPKAFLGGAVRTERGPECGSPWASCEGRRAPPASWAACCWPSNPGRCPATPSSGPAGRECRRARRPAAPGACSAGRSWCRAVLPSGWGRAPPVGRGWGDPARQRPPPGRMSGAAGWGSGLATVCETQWPEWRESESPSSFWTLTPYTELRLVIAGRAKTYKTGCIP